MVLSLAYELTALYGKGFDYSTLYKFVRFYKCFPQILDSASPQLERLSWTHFRVLLQVNDEAAREWYAAEGETIIRGAECAAVTYPAFFDSFKALGADFTLED